MTAIRAMPRPPQREPAAPVPAATIAALRELQRQRQFCIVSQSRCDRSIESFIARTMHYDPNADAAARKAVFKQASTVRKAVEAAGGGRHRNEDQFADAPSDRDLLILQSAAARAGWDAHRKHAEALMKSAARALPCAAWAKTVAGLGDLGLAILIGETGDLANYETKERVWKRLGLAVIDGVGQSRRSNAEQAAAHGFSPKRRAEVWAIADAMFRHQWRGAKEDAPAHPIGPYGAIYGRRKAHTATREGWTPKHRDNDARRVMTKALIEDLWRVWNGKPPLARMDAETQETKAAAP